MQIDVNGTTLWFDVVGPALVPHGRGMRVRPTLVLVHGGPGSYDHSYLRPHFDALTARAQVVYLDLRDHGRSARNAPGDWSFEQCADDVRAFCDTLGIRRPVVLGHSMGGCIALLYGTRHADHPGALIVSSGMARFDLDRLVEDVRRVAGDEVADLAGRDYSGDPVSVEEWARVYAAFGPHVPTEHELARRIRNPELGAPGMEQLRRFDVVDQLARITCPTLVCVGELDPITPPGAAREIVAALPRGVGRLAMIAGAGHFPWLDNAADYRALISDFVSTVAPDVNG